LRIFGLKRDEVTGEWRKLHNEELNDLYSSPHIRVVRSRRVRWAGSVARMGERRGAHGPGVDGKIILRRIFRKWDVGLEGIDMAEDGVRWQALKAVMDLRISYNAGNFLTT